MYHVSAQGVDERMINVHYIYMSVCMGQRWHPTFHVLVDTSKLFICCQLYALWSEPRSWLDENKGWLVRMIFWFFFNWLFCWEEPIEEWSRQPKTIHKFSFNQSTANTGISINPKEKICNSLQTSICLNDIIEICVYFSLVFGCNCKLSCK